MNYQSSIRDDDHPAGASPWGSPPATPQRNATNYSSISSSQSPTPFQYGSRDAGNGFAQEDPGIDAFRRPNTASSTSSTTAYDDSEVRFEPSQQQPATFGSNSEAQPSAPQHQLPPQGEPSNNGPSDAPGAQQEEQQPRRPPGPQYKLQAKITGLERTGKKDPILRFDVHVRTTPLPDPAPPAPPEADEERRQTYLSSGPPNSAMSAVYIPNSSSSVLILYPPIPMPLCRPCPLR